MHGAHINLYGPCFLTEFLRADLGLDAKDHSPDSGMTMILSSLR